MTTAKVKPIGGNLYVFTLSSSAQIALWDESQAFFQRGLMAETTGDTNKALDFYQESVDLDPNASGSLVNMGTIFYRRRDWISAEKYYRMAIGVNPSYALAHFNLGDLFDELDCPPRESIQCYEMALRFDPEYADAHFNIALVYQRMELILRASFHFRAYLKYAVGDVEKWRRIAVEQLEFIKHNSQIRIIPKSTLKF